MAAVVAILSLPGVASSAPGDLTSLSGAARCLDVDTSTDCLDAKVESDDALDALAFSPDGDNAYLGGTDRLVVLDRTAESGTLAPAGCFDGFNGGACSSAGVLDDNWREFGGTAVVVSPDGKHVYVGGSGPWDSAIFVFARNVADGSLTPVSCVSEVGDATCPAADGLVNLQDLEITPDGKNLYSFADNEGIATFTRDPISGALTQSDAGCIAWNDDWRGDPEGCTAWTGLGQMSSSGTDADLAVSPDGGMVLLGGRAGMLGFARDAATGALTQSGCISSDPVGGCQQVAHVKNVMGLAFTTDTNHLYARTDDGTAPKLLAFARPAATTLAPLAGQMACYGPPDIGDGCTDVAGFGGFLAAPRALAVSADGASVLAGSAFTLRSFSRDASTGALTATEGVGGCLRDESESGLAGCASAGTPFPSVSEIVLPPDGENVSFFDGSTLLTAAREAPPAPDLAAPTIVEFATPPLTKGTYTQNAVVRAAYRCEDDRPGVSCTGPVAAGAAIDTSKVGTNIPFKVTATDGAGHQTSVTHFYDVVTPQSNPIEQKPTPTPTVLAVPAAPPVSTPPAINPEQQVLNWFGGDITWLTKPTKPAPATVPAETLERKGVSTTVTVSKPGTTLNAQLTGELSGGGMIKPGPNVPKFENGKIVTDASRNGIRIGGNVVSAGGANVVSAGGANVVSAGGANVVSAGGANVVARASAAKATRKARQVVLAVGSRRVTRRGKATVTVRLTSAGRKLVARHRSAARAQRRKGRTVAPLVLRFNLVAGTTDGALPAVYTSRTITIR